MTYISTFSVFIKSSSLLCILGLGMGTVLLREQQKLVCANAAVSIVTSFHSMFPVDLEVQQAARLGDQDTSYGFQSTAIAHSLPQASFAWALLLLAMQGFWITFSELSRPIVAVTCFPIAAILVAGMGIWKAVHPRQKVSGAIGTIPLGFP